MMGTLRRQLGEMRIPDALPAVLEEIGRVRAELGYPIMVTPYSQFVGSQAVLNVVAGRAGGERWERLPDEVIRYALGHFGAPPGPIAELVLERVAAAPRTKELDRPGAEPTEPELTARVSTGLSRPATEEEVVLRTVLPGDQLDGVAAAGPAPRWEPGPPAATVQGFLHAVRNLPRWRSLQVTVGDESISLTRRPTGGEVP